ncbi:MAG TPA: adenylate/guanylate cyclase domain-containing protein [Verrucomicrobia bacterium]|nr:adenylate/guanylate cyclase domain-containing protein [Verrucomicrobiota bacterium]HOP96711.1 adenylate/guanylate cyclase domain-containing protein [Verrucomicrobiota bacterium]
MKLKPVKLAPILLAAGVLLIVGLLRMIRPGFIEQVENDTYDFRVQQALRFPAPAATNLGFVHIDDASIAFLRTNRVLGYNFDLYWPRQVYGRVVNELAAQGARAIAFDVVFALLRVDHGLVPMQDGTYRESDEFFALQLERAGNVILADTRTLHPHPLFATNAYALGDITTDHKDAEGVLRRVQAFYIRTNWHELFRMVEEDPEYGVDLSRARIEPDCVVLPRPIGDEIRIPLDSEGRFEVADFIGTNLPPGMEPRALPYTLERVWHLGIHLAARELELNLANAEVDLDRGEIVLQGRGGLRRVIPVEPDGSFYIDWTIVPQDPRLTRAPITDLLLANRLRIEGRGDEITNRWKDKLVLVASSATGNDLTDQGATPLDKHTILGSAHWNIANSIIMNRFVRRTPLGVDLAIIVLLGVFSAAVTWQFRVWTASVTLVALMLAYVAVAFGLYVQHRLWVPLVLPLGGAVLMNYVALLAWRVVFEQAEQRRVRSIFSTVVSRKIMEELLKAEKLKLGGAQREVTILFADVRGFTEFTDVSQERAAEHVARHQLKGEAAQAYLDEQARQTLATINLYLGLVADTIVQRDATLDKFIGDCVMAFWGAPTENLLHASACVRAAVEAQRAVFELNRQREAENRRIAVENERRAAQGLEPLPLLPILTLGTGINTGRVTVGLMGSESTTGVRQGNYTVFGREVNLASRLESLSGHGRVLISEATYRHLLRDDPELAKTCIPLPPEKLKGFRLAVNVYEVPWRTDGPGAQGPSRRPGGLDSEAHPEQERAV